MVNLLLVSYGRDENSVEEDQHYSLVSETLTQMGATEIQHSAGEVHASAWYVATDKSAQEIYNDLYQKCGNYKKVFVISLNNIMISSNSGEVAPQELETQLIKRFQRIAAMGEGVSKL